jgi:Xaa-Pro dipeptidase
VNASSLYPRFSDAEFARRYALVRTAMQEAGLSALVLHGTAGSYQEVQYLSNFLVTREAMLIFPAEGEPTLFVQYYNHVPNARRVAIIADVPAHRKRDP